MYDNAILYGVDQERFWHYNLAEIRTAIKVRSRNDKAEFKQKLMLRDFEAERTAEYMSCVLSSNSTVQPYIEKFPELFKEEIQAKIDAELEENKQAFIAYGKSYEEGGEIYG